jgi:lysyl-tRNA synthetase class 2
MPKKDEDAEHSDTKLPYSYKITAIAKEIKGNYNKFEGKRVSIAGRSLAIRKSGKLIFVDVSDASGAIQCYFEFSLLNERFESVKALNRGDIIGVEGTVFKTNPGEISVKVEKFDLLSKAAMQLPAKWYGLKDVEERYRKRYLDLIMNQEVKELFLKRSRIISAIRGFLDGLGFVEFETPAIQPLYGGADAEPFKVFVNTLGEEDYLRIANELYLKRLIIGGFDKVYEIYKAFRNEDIDSIHSPEFTMIEWYQAYADYNDMMSLTEKLMHHLANEIAKGCELTYQGNRISMKPPFKRIKYVDSINEKVGVDVLSLDDEALFALAEKHGIRFEKGKRHRAHAYDKLFSTLVQPELIQPTFVVDFPKETSPLAREKRGNPKLIERFEFYIGSVELANAYSEQNDPRIQREKFEEEAKKMRAGDKAAEPLDMGFVEAMEYGMPPTGGLGLGIDRLVMIFADKASIKEVILFIMEKRKQ